MKGAENNIEDPKKAIVVYQECINTALALQGNKLIGLFALHHNEADVINKCVIHNSLAS